MNRDSISLYSFAFHQITDGAPPCPPGINQEAYKLIEFIYASGNLDFPDRKKIDLFVGDLFEDGKSLNTAYAMAVIYMEDWRNCPSLFCMTSYFFWKNFNYSFKLNYNKQRFVLDGRRLIRRREIDRTKSLF